MANKKKFLSPRKVALLWMAVAGVVMGVLIGYEQISILYVVTTIGLVVLLLIVAYSDLESVGLVESDETPKRF